MPTRPPLHQPFANRPGKTPRRDWDPFYHTAAWQRTRGRVLKRAGYRCEIALPGCIVLATTADHIRARTAGGSDDDSNLRACCAPCHNRRHPEKGRAARD